MRVLALATLLLLPLTVMAAPFTLTGSAASVGQNAFTVSVTPQYPEPFGEAKLSFLSDTLNLSSATLKVSLGKKVIYTGGVQTVSVPLGKPGVPVSATVSLTLQGISYTQTITLVPQEVSLIVEPLSSSHPLYLGKSRTPDGGNVRVVAVANLKTSTGKNVEPKLAVYRWSVDDTVLANASGVGKTSLLVASPLQYRTRSVSVEVLSQDGSLAGGGSALLSSEQPSVDIYENDPLLGIRFDRALGGTYSLTGAESTLYAVPFSFGSSMTPTLAWTLNGASVQTGPSITLRPTGSGKGSAALVLTAANSAETVTQNLTLTFGASPNLFGL